jgi:hypothetical protein
MTKEWGDTTCVVVSTQQGFGRVTRDVRVHGGVTGRMESRTWSFPRVSSVTVRVCGGCAAKITTAARAGKCTVRTGTDLVDYGR